MDSFPLSHQGRQLLYNLICHLYDNNIKSFIHSISFHFLVVQLLSHARLFATPWTAAHQASLSFPVSWSLLKLMSTELVMPSNHLILCRPLLPSILPSIRVFSSESALHISSQILKLKLQHSTSVSNEYSGLISFRIHWFDLLSIQGTLQDSSPEPQFESINSLVLSLLCGPILTSR